MAATWLKLSESYPTKEGTELLFQVYINLRTSSSLKDNYSPPFTQLKMTFPDFPLAQKIAVIAGAGSGINLAFARLCVQQGAKVIIADLKLTTEASTFISSLSSKSAVFLKCDVTKGAIWKI
jgi:type IV secretory pathway VirB2 component (pilin)